MMSSKGTRLTTLLMMLATNLKNAAAPPHRVPRPRPAPTQGKSRSIVSRFIFIGLVVGCSSWTRAEAPVSEQELKEPSITSEDRSHWSFRPLNRPALPDWNHWPKDAKRSIRNPIDLFVQDALLQKGLQLQPSAPPATLARRLTFDLTGLPPTLSQLRTLESAPSPRAWRRLIDALINSPAYGERWAQHWLDLARFAETDGFEHDKIRSDAWQYRDWVVAAWNKGLPYNAFVRAQLAGDLSGSSDDQIATMFCTSGPDMPDINSQDERRHELLNELTGAVGSVFMGLQIGCAQCHDHKYDPLSQADFYRLRALFEPAVHVQRNKSIGRLHHKPSSTPSRLLIRGDWQRPGPVVAPAAPRVVNQSGVDTSTRTALVDWLTTRQHPLTARVIVNRIWQHHFGAGLATTPSDFGVMGDWPSHPRLLDFLATELESSNWNLQHIQRMILDSATYRQVSHNGRQESSSFAKALEVDPANRLISRFPRKRLDGESLRDAMFAASDSLNRSMGGPGVRPPLPPELKQALLRGQWDESEEAEHYRRSIYIFARRNLRYPIFESMDRPAANASCARRSTSTTATQALLLFNSPLSMDAARRLAGTAAANSDNTKEHIRGIYRRAYARPPGKFELAAGAAFLMDHARVLRSRDSSLPLANCLPASTHLDRFESAALVAFCLAIINSNEFLYLD